MLFVLFKIENQMYGINAELVREVIALSDIEESSNAPNFIHGQIDYHGQFIYAIDLNKIISDMSARELLGTRIIIYEVLPNQPIGLLAEFVDEVVEVDADELNLGEFDYRADKDSYKVKEFKLDEILTPQRLSEIYE